MATVIKSKKAAEMLGVAKVTVNNWIRSGELPGSKIGGIFFTTEEAIQEKLNPTTPMVPAYVPPKSADHQADTEALLAMKKR